MRASHSILIVLNSFVALTSVAGGAGLLTGLNAPPMDMLRGSPFSSYAIPGVVLVAVVGGTAVTAVILEVRRHWLAAAASTIAGFTVIAFELTQMAVIGSPPGVARVLQTLYLLLGLIVLIVSATSTERPLRLGPPTKGRKDARYRQAGRGARGR